MGYKKTDFSLKLSLSLCLSFPIFLFSLPRKSFSSRNSTAREMEFMNSNAGRTFFFLQKEDGRYPRDILNSDNVSRESTGRGANYFIRK